MGEQTDSHTHKHTCIYQGHKTYNHSKMYFSVCPSPAVCIFFSLLVNSHTHHVTSSGATFQPLRHGNALQPCSRGLQDPGKVKAREM